MGNCLVFTLFQNYTSRSQSGSRKLLAVAPGFFVVTAPVELLREKISVKAAEGSRKANPSP